MTDAINGYKTADQERRAKKRTLLARLKTERISLRGLPGWQSDKDIVIATLQQDGNDLIYASEPLRRTPEVVLAAVRQNGLALRWANNLMSESKSIVLEAVEQNGMAIQFAAHPLRDDPDIAIAALLQTPKSVTLLTQGLQTDPDFAKRCIEEGVDVEAAARFSGDFATTLQRILIDHLPRPTINGWSATISSTIEHQGQAVLTPARDK